MENTKQWMGHPRGLATLFFTEMWERFSYYGMRSILILYLVAEVAKGGLGFSSADAGAVVGLYASSAYLLTLPGGWIADNIIGHRKAVWFGGIMIMIGHLILAIQAGAIIFFIGLAFVAFGTGFLKGNISKIVGDLYPEGGGRRDSGFSIFYMGINLGAVLGQIACPLLAAYWGWHYGFGIAAVGMLIGLIQYQVTGHYLGEAGLNPAPKATKEDVATYSKPYLPYILVAGIIAFISALQYFGVINIDSIPGLVAAWGYVLLAVVVAYFTYILVGGGLTSDEKSRVMVIFALFIGAVIFWSGFEQAATSFNLFTDKYVDKTILGWNVPTGLFQNLNSITIVILAPILAALWLTLTKQNRNPSVLIKFGLGLVFMGLGFWVMQMASNKLVGGASNVSLNWLIATYVLHSVGELCLSPVGLSATTKLSPPKYTAQMLGIWFVAAAIGNLVAGLFAGSVDQNDLTKMPEAFFSVVILGIVSGLIFIFLAPYLKKYMRGVE
jgi:proton-dependent oligopeptide transporter, POT family